MSYCILSNAKSAKLCIHNYNYKVARRITESSIDNKNVYSAIDWMTYFKTTCYLINV